MTAIKTRLVHQGAVGTSSHGPRNGTRLSPWSGLLVTSAVVLLIAQSIGARNAEITRKVRRAPFARAPVEAALVRRDSSRVELWDPRESQRVRGPGVCVRARVCVVTG